jgi:D-alanyl-D-alanine carboxypeptidase
MNRAPCWLALLLLGTGLSAVRANAQPAATDAIRVKLQRLADSIVAARPQLPGILIYARSGATGRTWRIASGMADTARRTRLEADLPVRIASNTKSYTAAAILRLMEQGKIALSDALSRHLSPELNALLVKDGYATDRITIEQVLSHRAGFAEHPEVPAYVTVVLSTPRKRWTREEQVRWMVDSLAPIGAPGERYKYSDTGYILLGDIIERRTGKNLAAAVRELVGFERLGLTRTWWETLEPAPPRARDRVHQYIDGTDSYGIDASFDLYGGGGITAPLEELGAFVEALVTGKVLERRETLDTMLAPRGTDRGGYGLGVYPLTTGGEKGYGHTGFWGTAAFHFPASKLTLAVAVTEQTQGEVITPTIAAAFRTIAGGGR